MSQKITGPIPATLDFPANWTIRFTALDPTTGAVVSGVTVTAASLIVTNVGGGDLSTSLFDVEPLFTPVPVDGEG